MTEGQMALIISGISALIALSIAIAAWRSAGASRKATQAQLYSRLFEEYASPQMAEALRILKEEFEYGEGHETRDIEDDKRFHDLESLPSSSQGAHRHIKYYFIKVLRLEKAGFLPEKLMKELGAVAGIDILYDAVKWFEKDQKSISEIDEIENICGRYEDKGRPRVMS